MDETQSALARRALCVGIGPAELPPAILGQLERSDWRIEYSADVYRALARIGLSPPSLVLISVDWIADSEVTFVEILRRSHRGTPVYVLGDDRSREKIDRAIRCGARAVASAEVLAALDDTAVRGSPRPIDRTASERSVVPQAAPMKKTQRLASPGNVFDVELDRRLREQLAADEAGDSGRRISCSIDDGGPAGDSDRGHATGPGGGTDLNSSIGQQRGAGNGGGAARVPWIRYDDSPNRTPPGMATPAGAAEDDSDPPLLTPDELSALLGDEWVAGSDQAGLQR